MGMTVKELITALLDCPLDSDVYIRSQKDTNIYVDGVSAGMHKVELDVDEKLFTDSELDDKLDELRAEHSQEQSERDESISQLEDEIREKDARIAELEKKVEELERGS